MGTIFVDKIKNGAGGATVQVDEIVNVSGDSDSGINLATNDNIKFNIAGSQKAAIDSSGNLLVGTTNVDIRGSSSDEGLVYRAGASLDLSMDGGNAEVDPFFTDIPALNTSLAAEVDTPV
jgi:hypothetical protein